MEFRDGSLAMWGLFVELASALPSALLAICTGIASVNFNLNHNTHLTFL